MSQKAELVPVINCKRTYDGVLQKGRSVFTSLNGNTNFTGIDALLLKLKTANENLQILLETETTKSITKQRQTGKKLILSILEQLGWNCVAQSNGNDSVFLTSGLDLKKSPEKVTFLPVPEKITTVAGDKEGQIKVSFKAGKGSRFYKVLVGLSETDLKQFGIYTTSRIVLSGLQSGTIYYMQVMACGPRGVESSWSPMFNKRAA